MASERASSVRSVSLPFPLSLRLFRFVGKGVGAQEDCLRWVDDEDEELLVRA